MNIEKNIYIRAIKFGLDHPDGFTYEEIMNSPELSLNPQEKIVIKQYLNAASRNALQINEVNVGAGIETLFLCTTVGGTDYTVNTFRYAINLESNFKYIDYLELKFARETATSAKRFSLLAVGFATASIIVAISIPFLATQTIKIDGPQFQKIESWAQLILEKSTPASPK